MAQEYKNKNQEVTTNVVNPNAVLQPKLKPALQPKLQPILQPKLFIQQKKESSVSNKLPSDLQEGMEQSFQQDFSGVSIQTQSEKAENLGAKAYTQGSEVHFAPGEFQPSTKEGKELIGHELTHVVQQRKGTVHGGEIHGKDLVNQNPTLEQEADQMGKLASEGKRVQVQQGAETSIQQVENPNAAKKINNQAHTIDASKGSTEISQKVVLVGIPETLTSSFKKIIDHLYSAILEDYNGGAHSKLAGGYNIKLSVDQNQLDFSTSSDDTKKKFTGRHVCEFQNSTDNKTVTVTYLGADTSTQYKVLPTPEAKSKFNQYCIAGSGWKSEELNVLMNTVNKIPNPILSQVSKLKISRGTSAGTGEAVYTSGQYKYGGEPFQHEIWIYNGAFTPSDTRFGDATTGFSSYLEQTIVHEIGHALDYTPLRKSFVKHTKARDDYNKSVQTFNSFVTAKKPVPENVRTKTDALENESILAKNEMLLADSHTGKGWVTEGDGYKAALVEGYDKTAFFKAYKLDGGDGITDYASVNLQENFAESFSYYILDPARFKSLRPNTYAYFATNFKK
ncbi:MAG: DUF4157 domain-containing protein [Cytophagaceae bacterium]|jgi:hypothetical protein|nr:DUF4157 domain-containing protein [Cytophagaceae bacterium]